MPTEEKPCLHDVPLVARMSGKGKHRVKKLVCPMCIREKDAAAQARLALRDPK